MTFPLGHEEPVIDESRLSCILVSKRKRGELVAHYLKKRNAVIQQLKDYEEQLFEAITPIRIGDIILFNRFHKGMTVSKIVGVVTSFSLRVSVTDIFVAVYANPCPDSVRSELTSLGFKTSRHVCKVLLSDVIAILAKSGSPAIPETSVAER